MSWHRGSHCRCLCATPGIVRRYLTFMKRPECSTCGAFIGCDCPEPVQQRFIKPDPKPEAGSSRELCDGIRKIRLNVQSGKADLGEARELVKHVEALMFHVRNELIELESDIEAEQKRRTNIIAGRGYVQLVPMHKSGGKI